MKIGLFDSGIGGLNVLKEFIKKYPNNEYIYYGDTLNVPYGEKDKETLLNLSTNIIHFFEEIKVDLIVIACGTVSSNCYSELKMKTSIPIIDIITPTIFYLKKLNLKSILLFGTKKTVESHIFKNSINNIIEVATTEFVPMIESNKIDIKVIENYLKKYSNINALVLGCTHYPILVKEFKKYLNKNTLIIDMGKVLVDGLNISNNKNYSLTLYFTKIDKVLLKNIENIIKTPYNIKKI